MLHDDFVTVFVGWGGQIFWHWGFTLQKSVYMHGPFSRFLKKTDFNLLKVAAALFADRLFVGVAEAHIINDLRICEGM